MSHYKLPKGAKRVGDWKEVACEPFGLEVIFPFGNTVEDITKVTYEAEVTYDNGKFVANGVMVELYRKGNRIYRQAFYGETAHSDAERESGDEISKLLFATA
jgi:hypothetical protein